MKKYKLIENKIVKPMPPKKNLQKSSTIDSLLNLSININKEKHIKTTKDIIIGMCFFILNVLSS